MEQANWLKQTKDSPLFPDMLWSRPENRRLAGKLLILGGNGYEFKAPANAYGDALEAGIGNAKVLLPDSMRKVVHDIFPEAEFAPTTPSGSFARLALAPALDLARWADGVLIAGDVGRNSETAIFLESLLAKYSGQVTVTRDAAEHCLATPTTCIDRPDTLLVLSFAQLQKLGTASGFTTAFTFDMDLIRLVDGLQQFTSLHPVHVITKRGTTIFVASGGRVSTTTLDTDLAVWRVQYASAAATWWLQNPGKPFESLTTSTVA